YQMLLKREEHENRYRQLVTMLSDLKSEVYFMSNNMEYIEAVMSDAFALYENLEDSQEENRQLSLQIAKDVHEIKKNYLRVIHGIDQISDKEPV
ncbi:sensor histidine kinase, partial [Aduncisulcus paluster]